MDYKVTMATTEDLDYFYKDWSLTIEGLKADRKNLDAYYEIIRKYTTVKPDFKFYIVKGWQMNSKYRLTGKNAYNDNLNIVVCTLESMDEPMKLAIPRFSWGGRWFTDIVDNNARREE